MVQSRRAHACRGRVTGRRARGGAAGVGLVVPVTTARAMAPFHTAGNAASLLGFVRMSVAALATVTMSVLHEGTVLDIPIVFLSLTGLAVLMFGGGLLLERGARQQ